MEVLAETTADNWLIRCDLQVKGVGQWQCEISICLPSLDASNKEVGDDSTEDDCGTAERPEAYASA